MAGFGSGEVDLTQPIIIAAIIGALVTLLVSGLGNFILHQQRLKFEERLAERKFEFDTKLAERKFELDRNLSDWKRRSEFAETALAEFYDAQARMRSIRSPMSFGVENDDRPGRDQEREQLRQQRDSYYPIIRRLNTNSEFFNSFYAKRYRAIALFGAHAEAPFVTIWQILNSISIAASMLLQDHEYDRPDPAFQERMRERIWEGLTDPDGIATQVQEAIQAAEELFRPVIEGRPRDELNSAAAK
jgi:hypothetical protein